MQIWIHDSSMKKITALNNNIQGMLSYTNSTWHSYLDQATSTFDFTIPKFSNGELHEDIKLINDKCFVSFYVNGSYQVFYIATLQEDDFNIQLTCNNTNLEYALEFANPFSSGSAQSIDWYLEQMGLLSFAAVEIGINEISDRKRTLTFESQETKLARLQSLISNFDAEFEFKVELNRDGTYKRIVINIYQKGGIGTDRKDVVLYYSNGLKGVQVNSDKTQMFNAGVFDGKDGVNLADVEFSEKNADGVEEFYSRKGDIFVYAPLSMQHYPATMRASGQDNWIRKDFQTEYDNVNDLKAYALKTLKQYAYPLMTYTASVQSNFVGKYTDLKLGDTVRIIDKNFAGGLALEARVSEMIISFDNPTNNSIVFTNYRKIDNKPTSALQSRIDKAVEDRLPYRIELSTTSGVTFKNGVGETIVKPSLYKGNLPYTTDVTWRWVLDGVVTVGMEYRAQAKDIADTAVLTVSAYIGNNEVATTEITLTNVNDGAKGDDGKTSYIHFAYADDDKGTNFSLTDTKQQYQGYYTDFTQSSSTDPTKYTWVDRLANVKVGGVNLIKQSTAQKGLRLGVSAVPINDDNHMLSDWIKVDPSTVYTLTAYENVNEDNMWYSLAWHSMNNADSSGWISCPTGAATAADLKGGKQYTSPANAAYAKVSYPLKYSKVKLERGNVSTDYNLAPEDTQAQIDSKADSALTQEQLNALAEKNRTLEAELEAKAALATVEAWKEAYDNYIAQNEVDKEASETNLVAATNRITALAEDWQDKKVSWSFLDTHIDFQNEGLILGKKGSSTTIRISNDRIAFYSSGKEVASISEGTLTIDNGIFAKSLQIGHFREEVYEGDNNINVIRWVD